MNFIIDRTRDKRIRADELFYQAGKVLWLPFCLTGVWFSRTGYDRYGKLADCAIRRRCGLPCPGCGGTRAFYFLFQGEMLKSVCFHPAVLFGVCAFFHFMALCFYRKHISGSFEEREIHTEYYLYAALGVILTQWVIKVIWILSHIM